MSGVCRRRIAGCALRFATVSIAVALAGCADRSGVEAAHIRVQLVSEATTVTPGRPFWVGLVQTVDPGWHTYWRNPGDSGAATRISWDLDDGWSASPIQWPAPERMPYGDLVNYGYTGQVLLPVLITPPDDLERGRVELTAEALWLVCADVCIPGEAELSLTLPVRSRPDEADPETAPLFERSRARLPVAASADARAVRRVGRIAITLQVPDAADAQQIWYFPHTGGAVVHAADQQHSVTAAGAVELLVEPGPAADDRVDGVVVIGSGGSARGYAIDVPITDRTEPRG